MAELNAYQKLQALKQQRGAVTSTTAIAAPKAGEPNAFQKLQALKGAKGIAPQYIKQPKEEMGALGKTLDVLLRPTYAVAGAAKAAITPGESVGKEFWKGLKGEDKETFTNVLEQAGWKPTTKLGKVARGTVGFIGDVLLDPTTYLGIGALTKTGKVAEAGAKLAPTLAKQAAAGERVLISFAGKPLIQGEKILKGLTKMREGLERFDVVQNLGKAFNIKAIKPLGITDEAWQAVVKGKERARVVYNVARDEAIEGGKALSKSLKELMAEGVSKEDISNVLRKFADPTVPIKTELIPAYDALGKIRGLSQEALEAADIALLKGFDLTDVLEQSLKEGLPKLDEARSVLKYDVPTMRSRSYFKLGDGVVNKETGELWKNGRVVDIIPKDEIQRIAKGQMKLPGVIGKGVKLEVADIPTINKAVGKELFTEDLGVISGVMAERTGRINAGLTFADNIKGLGKVAEEAPANWVESKLKMLSGLKFDPVIAKQLDEVWKKYNSPEEIGQFVKGYKDLLNAWKGTATYLNVPFHIRNFVSNVWQNWLAGISPLNSAYAKALKIKDRVMRGLPLSEADNLIYQDYLKNGLGTGVFASDIQKEIGKEFGKDANILTKALETPFSLGRAAGDFVENSGKLAHFIAKKAEGFNSEAAAESVRKFLFDYTDLSDIERQRIKLIFPFYTWTRKNIPLQIKTLITQPEKVARLGKVKAEIEAQAEGKKPSESILPDWLKESLPVYLGGDKKMAKYMVLGGYLPTADINRIFTPLKTLLSSASPFITTPFELAANYDTFFKNEIEEYEGQRRRFLGLNIPAKWKFVLGQIRPLNEISKVVEMRYNPLVKDYESNMGKRLKEYLSGFKIYDEDLKYLEKISKGKNWTPQTIEQKIERDLRKATQMEDKEEAKRLQQLLDIYKNAPDELD